MVGKIALYPATLLAIVCLYFITYGIDEYKYNGTQRTIKPKVLKWYFRHSKKRTETLIITFIRKLLAIVIFLTTTAFFILTFFIDIDGDEGLLILGIITVVIAFYLAYLSAIEDKHKKKYRKEHKAEEAAKVLEILDEYHRKKNRK